LSADLVTTVQSGVNQKATKAQMLTAATAEGIVLQGENGAMVQLGTLGDVAIICHTGELFTIADDVSFNIISRDVSSVVNVGDAAAGGMTLTGGLPSITMTAGGTMTIALGAGGSVIVQFMPTGSGIWAPAKPIDLADAVQRISAAVAGLLGFPIP
jgi:hypothetical protein